MNKENKKLKNIIVQKYGGTSVSNAEKIKNVAQRIINTFEKGNDVVAVVSAPGDTTDRLMEMAYSITDNPSERELDVLLCTGEMQGISLLAMALNELGQPAVSLTGSQVGILTDSSHNRARIKSIETDSIRSALDAGNVVIVAGFQGVSAAEDLTTLGRGGSDLSAVALAAVLQAESCEIYTDVDGVYTTDPSIVPGARKIDKITYDEMLELASAGAGVLQSRSMEVAKKHNIKIAIKSNQIDDEKGGTVVVEETKDLEQVVVRGAALDKNQVKFSIEGVPDRPGIAAQIFGQLAEEGINVDMIIQSSAHKTGLNNISFTINQGDLSRAKDVMERLKEELKAAELIIDKDVVKVSIVGIGMRSHAGVAARMFELLAQNSINIEMISTSEIKISCVVAAESGEKALRVLHKEFCE